MAFPRLAFSGRDIGTVWLTVSVGDRDLSYREQCEASYRVHFHTAIRFDWMDLFYGVSFVLTLTCWHQVI